MIVADADVPFPVIRALKILQYPIATFDEIGAPVRPDKALMEHVLLHSRVLVTRDMGIPSQAYVAQYPAQGLSIALLRWKTSTPKDFSRNGDDDFEGREEMGRTRGAYTVHNQRQQ